MRGQPDLLFWRIDTHNLDKNSDADCNGRDDEEGYDGVDINKNNNNNSDYDKNNDARSNNKNNNSRSNNNNSNTNSNKKNTSTNVDIITTHTVFAVEVKSSTDQLSEWQIAWFNLLNHAGLHVENFQVLDA